ncbi:MAG: hypothetical protein ACFFDT_08150 [Candidatus Hodarchaeota archaeon]
MTDNSTKNRPIVFVGEYYETIQQLISDYVALLEPNVIWVEYRVIPVLDLMIGQRIHPHLVNNIYFLPIPTLKDLDKLLESRELFLKTDYNFSTIIIDFPKDFHFTNDFLQKLRELAKIIRIILIMTEVQIPETYVEHIQVE